MPARTQFFADLADENHHAALLVAQVGAAPNELQLFTEIAQYDEQAGGLRPLRTYIIRVLGVLEHRIVNFGTTVNQVELAADHPLLYEYLTPPTAVFFRGQVTQADTLVLDIAQAHASTFGQWRHFPEYLNVSQPLVTLLTSGGGLLGQMPQPLAQRIVPVLEHHGLETMTQQGKPYVQVHDNPALVSMIPEVLLMGGSYFVAYGFSFEVMQGRQRPTNG